jgi:hypothetical protein
VQRRSTAIRIKGDMKNGPEQRSATAFNDDEPRRKLEKEFDMLPEHVEDQFDALAPINDQLVQAKGWWILEFWPVKVRVQKRSDEWQKVVRMNMGRFRAIREVEPKMHWTVRMRMSDNQYKIRNRMDVGSVWQVAA